MNVADLRDILRDLPDDAEVRLATQPSYPMQSHIDDDVRIVKGIVYLRESSQVYDAPYAPGAVYGAPSYDDEDTCAMCGRDVDGDDIDRQVGDCNVCNPA